MIKLFKDVSYRHSLWTTFSDFLEMSALAISNSVDWGNFRRREDKYKDVIKKYNDKELEIFPKILFELVDELDKGYNDVLGEIFMEMELGSNFKGQFFTPYQLCLLTAELTFKPSTSDCIELNEPCSGGGAMIIAFAEVMKKNGYNPQKQLKVLCQDLDIKCVYMSYIQLSLLGIPAQVCHMNTLSLEFYDSFKTPMWILGGWK